MAGTTLSELFMSAQKLKMELSGGLERLEKFEAAVVSSAGAGASSHEEPMAFSPELTRSIRLQLSELHRTVAEMDRMWRSQPQRGSIWKRKVESMAEEAEALRSGLDKYLVRESRRQRDAADRASLLDRRNGSRDASGSHLSIGESEADERDLESARSSSKLLEETLLTGYETLKKMAEQREFLKAAQRRALDALNYIGMSDTVLKRVNRRQVVDKVISYGGMVVLIVIVLLVWRYTR